MDQAEAIDECLTPTAAAHHLGVTTELLFQYTKRGFAKASGLRSLKAIDSDGETRFRRSELDSFDALLRGPWCSPNEARPAIPKAIVDHLRAESRNQCVRCGSGIGVDTAHIRAWAESRSHHPHNLLRLCSACHREHDAQHSLSTDQLLAIKQRLIAQTRAAVGSGAGSLSPLRRFPRPAAQYFGRETELEQLIGELHAGRSVAIVGAGGIGKTELLVQALAVCGSGRPIFWLEVEQFGSSADILSALRMALGADGLACSADELPSRLDALTACVVLDGIEQSALDDLDQFEDDIAALHAATRHVQFVSTSQVLLHRLPAERRIRLGKLDDAASRLLLLQSSAEESGGVPEELSPLLGFCEGHALTLRLAAALVDHFGGPAAALAAIGKSGVAAVRVPGRKRHHRQTSLELCLKTAYDALAEESRHLLWALSLAPAGMFTHYIDDNWLDLGDTAGAAGSLRRWHLIEAIQLDADISRTHVLSPIRRFAVEQAPQDDREAFESLVARLVQGWGMLVAVLELNYNRPEDTPYVLHRYGEELPNLLHALELAQARQDEAHLVETAVAIVRSLMRYFFVSRLPEQGSRVMHSAAQLAIAAGRLKMASGVAMQLISLALRADDDTLVDAGIDLTGRIETMTQDPEIHADCALSRAMASRDRGKFVEAEAHARRAVELYRSCLRARQANPMQDGEDEEAGSFARDELHNDLSQALGLLGFSLEGQQRYEEAAATYRHALRHERGASIAVNRGQTLHQIGNCESHAGNHRAAAEHYLEAARVFHFVGMQEYLSNALGELGYTLLDADAPDIVAEVDDGMIEHGLSDLTKDVTRNFDLAGPLDHQRCVGAIRKLFGMIALVSLSVHSKRLGDFCVALGSAIILPIHREIAAGKRDRDEIFPILMMDTALSLAALVAQAEHSFDQAGDIDDAIVGEALRIVCHSHKWAQDVMRVIDWLSIYLTSRWRLEGASRARLRHFVDNFDADIVDHLDLSRDSKSP